MGFWFAIFLTIIGTIIWNHYAKETKDEGNVPTYKGYWLYIWNHLKKP